MKTQEKAIDETKQLAASELDGAMWSVVSFDKQEAAGLTYAEAVSMLERLDAERVAGLCIVTDDAASRLA